MLETLKIKLKFFSRTDVCKARLAKSHVFRKQNNYRGRFFPNGLLRRDLPIGKMCFFHATTFLIKLINFQFITLTYV